MVHIKEKNFQGCLKNVSESTEIKFFSLTLLLNEENLFFRKYFILKGLLCSQYYLKQIFTEHITGSVLDNKVIKHYDSKISIF